MNVAECSACGAPLWWTLTPRGNRGPIDAEPSSDGTVLVLQPRGLDALLAVMLSGDTLIKARNAGVPLHKSHFATCPNADEFKKAGAGATRDA
jgi:hypothetical protein